MAIIDPLEPCPCGSGSVYGQCHISRVLKPELLPTTEHVPLRVIPEPDPGTRAGLDFIGEGSLAIVGYETGLSFDCGKCGAPLMRGVRRGQIRGAVLRCNACGAHNET